MITSETWAEFEIAIPISYPEPSCFLLRMLDEMRSKKQEGSGYEIVAIPERKYTPANTPNHDCACLV